MGKRSDYQQRKHDRKLRALMHYYRGKGWSVETDLPSQKQPDSIRGGKSDSGPRSSET